MKTKAEIEEVMRDHIIISECFSGRIPSEEDDELMHVVNDKVQRILSGHLTVTEEAKRLFDEVFEIDFTKYQWFCLVMILAAEYDIGKAHGARKTMEFFSEMEI